MTKWPETPAGRVAARGRTGAARRTGSGTAAAAGGGNGAAGAAVTGADRGGGGADCVGACTAGCVGACTADGVGACTAVCVGAWTAGAPAGGGDVAGVGDVVDAGAARGDAGAGRGADAGAGEVAGAGAGAGDPGAASGPAGLPASAGSGTIEKPLFAGAVAGGLGAGCAAATPPIRQATRPSRTLTCIESPVSKHGAIITTRADRGQRGPISRRVLVRAPRLHYLSAMSDEHDEIAPDAEPSHSAPAHEPAPEHETTGPGPEETMRAAAARIGELEASVEDLREKWMRSEAEAQNVRARARRDVDDARQFAVQKFAADVVEAAENLRRGLASLPEPSPSEDPMVTRLREGFEGVERNFLGILERNGIAATDPTGARFDANLHQAMAEQPSDTHPAGTVAAAWTKAWTLNGRLLKPAMVVVSSGGGPSGLDTSA